jgi:hypothetical protein
MPPSQTVAQRPLSEKSISRYARMRFPKRNLHRFPAATTSCANLLPNFTTVLLADKKKGPAKPALRSSQRELRNQ